MSHRFSTWWRALSVVLLCLATVTWPSAAWADTTPPSHRSPEPRGDLLSTMARRTLAPRLAHDAGPPTTTAQRRPSIPALRTRGDRPIIDGGPGSAATGPRPASFCPQLSADAARSASTSPSTRDRYRRRSTSCGGISPRLHLPCSSRGVRRRLSHSLRRERRRRDDHQVVAPRRPGNAGRQTSRGDARRDR